MPAWMILTSGWLAVTMGLREAMSSHFMWGSLGWGTRGLAKSMETRIWSGRWTGWPQRVALTVKRPEGWGSRIQRRR